MKSFIWIFINVFFLLNVFTESVHAKYSADEIRKVHVIFMNHLDVGYSDGTITGVGYAIDVINRYFVEYFPRAISLAEDLRKFGYEEKFVYTTHPWLVSLYVDCPDISLIGIMLKCPSLKEVNRFADAVKNGTIAWHAGPMNMQTDNMGRMLFGYGLQIGNILDEKFGINRTHATYSQRDVPGMTKATIPILMSRGVKAISVGVNPGTAPPAVPSPFVWKFSEAYQDGILAFWNKGGYPKNPGPDPAKPGGLARDQCVMAPGLDEALCFAFRTDNTGPPRDIQEILINYDILRAEFRNATIFASTFDNFVASLEKVKDLLPVRLYEIGDTWIQGISSDPYKISMYRAFVRCLEECFLKRECSDTDPRVLNTLRFLIKIPEHTWGAHNFLNDIDWSNSRLHTARQTRASFKKTELTWHEQRQFLYLALKALETHPLNATVKKAWGELDTSKPDLKNYYPANLSQEFSCQDGKIIQFASDGSLSRLYDPFNQVEWASVDHPLGKLTYDTYVEEDFTDMAQQYDYDGGAGYDKPNMTLNGHPKKRQWKMGVISFHRKNDYSCNFWLELIMFDIQTTGKYGAPQSFFLNYISSSEGFDISVLVIDKTTTRLPESLSFQFTPQIKYDNQKWRMNKMGEFLDPCPVVLNGSQYVHAVDSAVSLTNGTEHGLYIVAKDSPLIFWGTPDHVPSPFPVPLQPFKCSTITSVAFNLFNNIWNTNYMYWYPYAAEDANFKSRYKILFQ